MSNLPIQRMAVSRSCVRQQLLLAEGALSCHFPLLTLRCVWNTRGFLRYVFIFHLISLCHCTVADNHVCIRALYISVHLCIPLSLSLLLPPPLIPLTFFRVFACSCSLQAFSNTYALIMLDAFLSLSLSQVMQHVLTLVRTSKSSTMRDVYYMDCKLFGNQTKSDRIIELLARCLNVPRYGAFVCARDWWGHSIYYLNTV